MTIKGGFYNSEPLEKFLKSRFEDFSGVHRDIDFGIVDLMSGDHMEFSTGNLTSDNVVDALFASMSVAGFFPPAEVFDSMFIDGSSFWDLDIFDPVLKCKDKGFAESDIVIDVIMTSSASEIEDVEGEDYKSIRMLMRYSHIASYYQAFDGLLRARFAFSDATFRHTIMPTKNLYESRTPFDMREREMNRMISIGVDDAVKALSNPTPFNDLLQYYSMKRGGDERIYGLTYGDF